MKCTKYWNKKIKKMNIWDIKCIKLSSMAFILFIASFWPDWFASLRWLWLVLFVLFAIKPMCTMFKK